jgi:hypothetical protein
MFPRKNIAPRWGYQKELILMLPILSTSGAVGNCTMPNIGNHHNLMMMYK